MQSHAKRTHDEDESSAKVLRVERPTVSVLTESGLAAYRQRAEASDRARHTASWLGLRTDPTSYLSRLSQDVLLHGVAPYANMPQSPVGVMPQDLGTRERPSLVMEHPGYVTYPHDAAVPAARFHVMDNGMTVHLVAPNSAGTEPVSCIPSKHFFGALPLQREALFRCYESVYDHDGKRTSAATPFAHYALSHSNYPTGGSRIGRATIQLPCDNANAACDYVWLNSHMGTGDFGWAQDPSGLPFCWEATNFFSILAADQMEAWIYGSEPWLYAPCVLDVAMGPSHTNCVWVLAYNYAATIIESAPMQLGLVCLPAGGQKKDNGDDILPIKPIKFFKPVIDLPSLCGHILVDALNNVTLVRSSVGSVDLYHFDTGTEDELNEVATPPDDNDGAVYIEPNRTSKLCVSSLGDHISFDRAIVHLTPSGCVTVRSGDALEWFF
jgi:hypothetical protein